MSDANSFQRDCESGPWDEVCKETKLGGTHVLKQEYVDAMWNRFSATVLFATVSLKSRVTMRGPQPFWLNATVVRTQLLFTE